MQRNFPRPALSQGLRRDDPGSVADPTRMARRATADLAPQRMVGPVRQGRSPLAAGRGSYAKGGLVEPRLIRPRAAMAMKGLK